MSDDTGSLPLSSTSRAMPVEKSRRPGRGGGSRGRAHACPTTRQTTHGYVREACAPTYVGEHKLKSRRLKPLVRASRPDRGGVRTTGQREPPGLTGAGVSPEERGRALSLRAASAPPPHFDRVPAASVRYLSLVSRCRAPPSTPAHKESWHSQSSRPSSFHRSRRSNRYEE